VYDEPAFQKSGKAFVALEETRPALRKTRLESAFGDALSATFAFVMDNSSSDRPKVKLGSNPETKNRLFTKPSCGNVR
jgi:hypothetical protein